MVRRTPLLSVRGNPWLRPFFEYPAEVNPPSTPSDPNARLEEAWVEEYLRAHGYTRDGLRHLSPDVARVILADAVQAAAERRIEMECKVHWLRGIHRH